MTAQKIWTLLTPPQRRSAVMLFGLMIVGTLLETLGVALAIPALALLTQQDFAVRHPVIASMLNPSGTNTPETLVVSGLAVLVGIFVAKNVFLAYSLWRQNSFTFGLLVSLSHRLFTRYLRQPYTFHLQRNSAQLVQNVVGEVDHFTNSVVNSAMQVLAESMVLVGIMALVMLVEPVGALIVIATTSAASLAFYLLSHSHVLRWGEHRQLHSGLRYQHLQEGLGGVKDVKLLGRETDFLEQFGAHSQQYARVGGLQNTLLQMPRLWLELLVVAGLAALIATMLARGKPLEAVYSTLGLFAAAAFRLMPSVSRILGALQALKFGLPAIDTLHGELTPEDASPETAVRKAMPFQSSLVLGGVSFRYSLSSDTFALLDVHVDVPRGSAVGIIGQSGAGKSTLVDVMLGLLTPERGTVRVDGVDIQTDLRGWQNQIGYVPQSIFLTDASLRRNVAFGLTDEAIDDARVWRAIRLAQLESFVNELPNGIETVVGERGVRLSGGQRQRIGIARALYHDPAVLVLDEATSSLDTTTEASVMEAVRALHGSKTIIIVSHRLSTVECCDRLYRLDAGRVVDNDWVTPPLNALSAR